ncbi:MAG: protein phosphatase CheZ [Deltaproteobacteria bacterium]|nr:protein phosphatase CheZ [Deltaproteobacteria bacterium]
MNKQELSQRLKAVQTFGDEYGEILDHVAEDEGWQEPALAMVNTHHERFLLGQDPLADFSLFLGITQFFLHRLKQDQFTFRLPTRMAILPEAENEEILELSNRLKRYAEPVDAILADISSVLVGEQLPDREKIPVLLESITSLFKGLLRQDWADVEIFLAHINLITTSRERGDLVEQIAKIAREIYNSLNSFSEDFSLDNLTHSTEEIPDAVVKMKSVISRLEDAANKNLDQLERLSAETGRHKTYLDESGKIIVECIRDMESLGAAHPELEEELSLLRLSLAENVTPQVAFLEATESQQGQFLLNLISNQGFQDLTGQTLRRVIEFVESLQSQLVELLEKYARRARMTGKEVPEPSTPTQQGEKPAAIKSQAEVDSLLADLGF